MLGVEMWDRVTFTQPGGCCSPLVSVYFDQLFIYTLWLKNEEAEEWRRDVKKHFNGICLALELCITGVFQFEVGLVQIRSGRGHY